MSTNDHNDHAKRAARIALTLVSESGDYAVSTAETVLKIGSLASHVRSLKETLKQIEERGVAKCYYKFSECVQNKDGTVNYGLVELLGKGFSEQLDAIECSEDDYFSNVRSRFHASLKGVESCASDVACAKSQVGDIELLVLFEYVAHKGHGINIENL